MTGKNIINLIIKSPFRLVREHMECISFSMKKILPFVNSIEKQHLEKANNYYLEIKKLKMDADYIKKNVNFALNNSIFMNMSRTDLLNFLKIQTNIFSQIEYVSSLLISKNLKIPHFIFDNNYYQFMQSCVDACNEAFLIIIKLEKTIDNGFPKKEIQILNAMIKKLYIIENVSNRLQNKLRNELFERSNTTSFINIMYLYKIMYLIGSVSHMSRQIGKKAKFVISH